MENLPVGNYPVENTIIRRETPLSVGKPFTNGEFRPISNRDTPPLRMKFLLENLQLSNSAKYKRNMELIIKLRNKD